MIHTMANNVDHRKKKIILLQMIMFHQRALSFLMDHSIWTFLLSAGVSAVFWLLFSHWFLERENFNLWSSGFQWCLSNAPGQKLFEENISIAVLLFCTMEWEYWITRFSLFRFHKAPKSKGLCFIRFITKPDHFSSPLSNTALKDSTLEEFQD